jgi:hypothetical protein
MLALLAPFAPLFSCRIWPRVLIFMAGTLLAPGKRTVTAALRVMGLAQTRRFERCHRALNRARWSSLAVSYVLLTLLVAAFAPSGPLLLGIDETIERRRGKRIAAKGIYRDPVRSSREHFVKASGLRWICLMLLARLCPLARQKKRGRVRLTHTPLQERVSHVYPARADHTRVVLL